jgi:hypothetical protein
LTHLWELPSFGERKSNTIREAITGCIAIIEQLISTLANIIHQKKTPHRSKNYWKQPSELSLPPLRNYPSDDLAVPKLHKQVHFLVKLDLPQLSQDHFLPIPYRERPKHPLQKLLPDLLLVPPIYPHLQYKLALC